MVCHIFSYFSAFPSFLNSCVHCFCEKQEVFKIWSSIWSFFTSPFMSKWSEQREDTFSNMNTPPSLPGSNRKNGNFGMQDNKGLFAPSARLPRGHKPITAATSTGGRTSGSIGKLDRVMRLICF